MKEPAAMTDFHSTMPVAPASQPMTPAQMRAYPLGTLVLRAGLMPLEVIDLALAEAVHSGRRLGEVLIEYGLPDRDLARLLAAQHGQQFIDLLSYPIDPAVSRLLPHSVADMYCALPVGRDGDCVVVAVPDADNSVHLTRLRDALQRPVRLVSAARSDIKDAIERVYSTAPQPATPSAPAPPPQYRIIVTLESGATFLVAEAPDVETAKALGLRVYEEAQAGGTVAVGEATIDGRKIVAVDVLHREGA
jgi:Type II secretion system (T2SS), protein E, N-terminal domain